MMTFKYLIFLCIGTYVGCLPIQRIDNALSEAMSYRTYSLAQMENDVQKTLVDIPETLTDDCIKNNLEIFARSLNRVSQFIPDGNVANIIMHLSKIWPKQEKKGKNCTTSQGGPRLLVETLGAHLIEWNHYLHMRN